MLRFVLTGETPAKKNSRINTRSGKSFPSKRYQAWHTGAMKELFEQKGKLGLKPANEDFRCRVYIKFIHGDLRRRDSDNGTSSIFDLLTDSEILPDDNWKIVSEHHIFNDYDKGNPHCIICIYEDSERFDEKDFKL